MSIFKKIADKLAGESAHLKKIRMQAEERRAGKSGQNAKVDADDVISKTAESLAARIDSGKYK